MLGSYLKIAWRNLLRDRQFSVLNLIGLSVGLACTLLIFLWIRDESSIDKFNEKDRQLYQVIKTSLNVDGTIETHETTPGLLAKSMALEIPEIEFAVSVVPENSGVLSVGEKYIRAKPQFVDIDFLNIFSFHLIEGDKTRALTNKHGVILSEQLALKLFGTTDNVIGRTLVWDGEDEDLDGNYIVTGVFKMPPVNASMQFDVLFNYSLYYDTYKEKYGLVNWYSNNPQTFLILKEGTDIQRFNEKIRDFANAKFKAAHGSVGEYEGIIFVQRYSDKYLYNRYENGVQTGGRIEYVRLFTVIAIFILVIACINFMNLATARASKRIKEVGIKKVIGAKRKTLIFQYLGESIIMAIISAAGAILVVLLLLPPFRELTGKALYLDFSPGFISILIAITIVTGLLAGSYPAFYVSGFRPAAVLKGNLNSTAGESWTRKGLVVFQFAISVILIISVVVVYKQMELVQNRNLGFNKNNVLQFANEGKLRNSLEPFLAEFRKMPGVINVGSMSGDLVGNHSGGGGISWPGQIEGHGIEFDGLDVDAGLMGTLDLKMKEGRFFSSEYGNEENKVIFNEAAILAMGLKDPVGQTVTMWGSKKVIIGVVRDFHFESLYKKVGPFFFRYSSNNNNVLVKIAVGKERETIGQLEKFYKNYNLGLAFEYKFMNDDYEKLYFSEERVSVLSRYFATIAVIVSCLGLFGLAAFTAQKRRKEIGIRKVVGASVSNIAYMLSKDFLTLIVIAILVAFPLAWWIMNAWLNSFAYRVNIDAPVFLIAAFATIFISVVTISFQSIKAAIVNPVDTLRSE